GFLNSSNRFFRHGGSHDAAGKPRKTLFGRKHGGRQEQEDLVPSPAEPPVMVKTSRMTSGLIGRRDVDGLEKSLEASLSERVAGHGYVDVVTVVGSSTRHLSEEVVISHDGSKESSHALMVDDKAVQSCFPYTTFSFLRTLW
ncbi:hypothetical protein BC829DRAFT_409173, partial [Chytridium lagenaria]